MTISVCRQDTNIEAQLWIVRGVCAEPEAGSQGKPGWTFEAACVALKEWDLVLDLSFYVRSTNTTFV